jgi:MFS family permease
LGNFDHSRHVKLATFKRNLSHRLIDRILDSATFIAYSFLLRGTEALGAAAYSTASYTFVVQVFPDHIGPVMGILETFVGLGMSVGPVIGGVLYSVFEFYFLFSLMSLLIFAILRRLEDLGFLSMFWACS